MAQARRSGEKLSLPNCRAFLIRYSAASNLEDGDVSGRVEHVDSGQSARFHSRQELDDFIGEVIREQESKQAQEGRETWENS